MSTRNFKRIVSKQSHEHSALIEDLERRDHFSVSPAGAFTAPKPDGVLIGLLLPAVQAAREAAPAAGVNFAMCDGSVRLI